jgi:hypothetical protein
MLAGGGEGIYLLGRYLLESLKELLGILGEDLKLLYPPLYRFEVLLCTLALGFEVH